MPALARQRRRACQQNQPQRVLRRHRAVEQPADGGGGDHRQRQRARTAQGPQPRAREAPQGRCHDRGDGKGGAQGHGMHAQVARLHLPELRRMGLRPQRNARHGNHHPGYPDAIAARRQGQRQGQRCPQRKQLPGVRSRLVGLPEKGEQSTRAQQRQHRQRHARRRAPCRAKTHHEHKALQQGKALHAAHALPIGGNPQHDAQPAQRRAQQGHHGPQAGSERSRFLLESRQCK